MALCPSAMPLPHMQLLRYKCALSHIAAMHRAYLDAVDLHRCCLGGVDWAYVLNLGYSGHRHAFPVDGERTRCAMVVQAL
jgi:hypothetical protein